jgi:hypothetical protein
MTQSLTDSLQQSRMVVVAVDPARRRIRVRGADACSEVACADTTLVLTDDGPAGLEALNPGDVIRVQPSPDAAPRIVVLRRVWEELTSPEW